MSTLSDHTGQLFRQYTADLRPRDKVVFYVNGRKGDLDTYRTGVVTLHRHGFILVRPDHDPDTEMTFGHGGTSTGPDNTLYVLARAGEPSHLMTPAELRDRIEQEAERLRQLWQEV